MNAKLVIWLSIVGMRSPAAWAIMAKSIASWALLEQIIAQPVVRQAITSE